MPDANKEQALDQVDCWWIDGLVSHTRWSFSLSVLLLVLLVNGAWLCRQRYSLAKHENGFQNSLRKRKNYVSVPVMDRASSPLWMWVALPDSFHGSMIECSSPAEHEMLHRGDLWICSGFYGRRQVWWCDLHDKCCHSTGIHPRNQCRTRW